MNDHLPLIAPPQAAAALHGSYCPKMCTFACPVAAATGRDDAVPWSFHRTVADLAAGLLEPTDEVAGRLTACTGCLACQVPCVFDQDVPDQVRAGRAALHTAGAAAPAVERTVARVAAGGLPYPHAPTARAPRHTPGTEGAPDRGARATVAVVVGCRDDATTVTAALRLLRAAGEGPAVVVPEGCCGAVLRDLGANAAADGARDRLAGDAPAGVDRAVCLDPHCLDETRAAFGPAVEVEHVVVALHRLLEAGRLSFDGRLGPVTYHDPCLLARDASVVEEPRALLRAAGATVVEPEGHGRTTVCSGAGLGLELLDETAAEATAERRRRTLRATDTPVVTACGGARDRLGTEDLPVSDLLELLAGSLSEDRT